MSLWSWSWELQGAPEGSLCECRVAPPCKTVRIHSLVFNLLPTWVVSTHRRKLVIRGFRVAVLVRSLSSETLNRLGSGVSYSYGDMTEYRTLLDAMEDVDKVTPEQTTLLNAPHQLLPS